MELTQEFIPENVNVDAKERNLEVNVHQEPASRLQGNMFWLHPFKS